MGNHPCGRLPRPRTGADDSARGEGSTLLQVFLSYCGSCRKTISFFPLSSVTSISLKLISLMSVWPGFGWIVLFTGSREGYFRALDAPARTPLWHAITGGADFLDGDYLHGGGQTVHRHFRQPRGLRVLPRAEQINIGENDGNCRWPAGTTDRQSNLSPQAKDLRRRLCRLVQRPGGTWGPRPGNVRSRLWGVRQPHRRQNKSGKSWTTTD